MDISYLSFDTGISDDRIYAHRGDIFVCDGLFKPIDEVDKDDHIIAKPTRPVLIISNDENNINVVKVLPFSSRSGSEDANAISSGRVICVPSINNNPNSSFIDVSQVFTINTHQLKIKLGHASQEIVDAAVALHTLQNICNDKSVDMLVRVFKDRYPKARVFSNGLCENNSNNNFTVTNMYHPDSLVFADVQQVSQSELMTEVKSPLKQPNTREEAYQLYQEWLTMGTDLFRKKYGITKQQYFALRDKCVSKMLGKIPNFKKHDWSC